MRPRYVCDQGKHHHPLADLTEVRPAVLVAGTVACGQVLGAQEQWASDTNITQPIPQTERTRLNTWRAERTRKQHGGKSW